MMKKVVFCFLIFFSLFLICHAAHSNIKWDNCLGKKINRIDIKGIEQDLKENLEKILLVKQNQQFSIYKINQDIKNLLNLNLFQNIQVTTLEREDNCDLTYILSPFFYIREVDISGISEIFNRELYNKIKDEITVKLTNKPFRDDTINKAKNDIIQVLKNNGYINSEINIKKNIIKYGDYNLEFEIDLKDELVIEKIEINGLKKSEENKAYKKIELNKGMLPKEELLRESSDALKEYLKNKGYFMSSVSYKTEIINPNGIKVIFDINKGKKIDISVEGTKIDEKIFYPLWKSVVFPPWAIEEGKNKIINELRKNGYILPDIKVNSAEQENMLQIKYIVEKGKRYKLGQIIFEGNNNFDDRTLRETLKIYLKDFFTYAYFNGAIIKDLIFEIEAFYWRQGFKRTKIDLNFIKKEDKIDLQFIIDEGIQTIIKSVDIISCSFFNPYYLKQGAGIKTDIPYNNEVVEQWRRIIRDRYYLKGFDNVKIKTDVRRKDNNIEIIISIDEGNRFIIKDVIWIGKKNISKSLFWNNILLKKGNYLDKTKINKTKNNLENLGVFRDIKLNPLTINNEEKILVISTVPGKTTLTGYSVGWGERVGLRGTFEYQKHNLFKHANTYSLILRYGKNEKRAILNFDSPWKTSLNLKTFFSVYYEEEVLKSYSYRRKALSLNEVKKFTDKSYLNLNLKIGTTKLLSLDISPTEVDRENAPYSTSSLSLSYSFDNRDNPFNPTSGYYFSSDATLAFKFLGTESEYFKISGKYQHVWRLRNDIVIFNQLRWGFGWGSIPIPDRYFAGGSSSFRGSSIDGLGPMDPATEQPTGGKAQLINNFEISLPPPIPFENLKIAFFYDKGNVLQKSSELFKTSFDDAVGMGLRYETPLGPLRVDLGWNLEKDARRAPYVYFAIGNIF